jgi:membrane fusion protein (multidrug efflux system)
MNTSAEVLDSPVLTPARLLNISRKRLAISAGGVLLLVTAILFGHRWWTTGRFVESTDDAYVGGDVTEISPHVSGFITNLLVSDNQRVSAGQELIRIDAAFNANDAKRYRDLALTKAGSGRDAEKAQTAARTAQSAVAAAAARQAAARKQLSVFDAAIGEAQAALAQAQAELSTARLNLGYTVIRAPIDGYVGDRSGQVGAYVIAGTHLLSVVPARDLWVDANFKEDQIGHMSVGQPATVVVDVMPGRQIHGRVLSVAPATGAVFSVIPPQNATGNFTKIVQRVPIRIALDADDVPPGLLRPGLSTNVSVNTRSEESTR